MHIIFLPTHSLLNSYLQFFINYSCWTESYMNNSQGGYVVFLHSAWDYINKIYIFLEIILTFIIQDPKVKWRQCL
jgi:hypothetical protein